MFPALQFLYSVPGLKLPLSEDAQRQKDIRRLRSFTGQAELENAYYRRAEGRFPAVKAFSESPKGIVLIHGLMGSPHIWTGTDQYLSEQIKAKTGQDIPVKIIELNGHGDKPTDRACDVTMRSILSKATSDIKRVTEDVGGPVLLVGHSLGSTIAIHEAARYPQRVAGLVQLGAPHNSTIFTHPLQFFTEPVSTWAKGALYWHHHLLPFKSPRVTPRDLVRFRQIGRRLLTHVDKCLPHVSCPVWLFHSVADHVVPLKNMHSLFERLRVHNPVVTRSMLHRSGHQVHPFSADKQVFNDHVVDVVSKLIKR